MLSKDSCEYGKSCYTETAIDNYWYKLLFTQEGLDA